MNTKFLTTVSMLVLTSTYAFSLNVISMDGGNPFEKYSDPRGLFIKYPKTIPPAVSYNSASTTLTVKFPATSGGKVEIYRNDSKVVSTATPAGASLSFVLRNYGAGNYTVIVSQGNTVVYNRTMKVK